jgi:hypothetical protein
LSTCTYSSNKKLILLPSKFFEESGGFALTNSGGRLSLNPPAGGTILAQPEPLMMLMEMIVIKATYDIKTLKFIYRLQT